MKKRCVFLLMLFLLCTVFILPTAAEEGIGGTSYDPENAITDFFNALPDAIRGEMEGAGSDGLSTHYDSSYYIRFLLEEILGGRDSFLSLLATLFGFILLSAAIEAVSGKQRATVELILSAALAFVLYQASRECFSVCTAYLQDISAFGRMLLPIMGGLYAAGGNTATAVSSGAAFSLFLTVLEYVAAHVLMPLVSVLFALALVGIFENASGLSLSGIGDTVKKLYMTVILFFAMFLGVMLSAQTLLSSAADSAAQRTIRYAVGNMIPVVGGSVSAAFGTLSASVGYLRATVGGGGVTAVLLLTIPVIVRLLIIRFVLTLSEAAAGLLSGKGVKAVIHSFLGIYDVLLATVTLSSVAFLLSVTLFAKCAAAI